MRRVATTRRKPRRARRGMRAVTCSKCSDFGTPRSKCRAFGTPQPAWDPSRSTSSVGQCPKLQRAGPRTRDYRPIISNARASRRRGTQCATGKDPACGGRRCLDIPNGRHRNPVHPRAGRSRSPHARRLGANVDQRQDRGKGQGRGRRRNRRLAAQDAVRRHGLRPDGQNAPPPPRVREGCSTTEERVNRSNLGPHEATEEPMLVRAPSPAFFAR